MSTDPSDHLGHSLVPYPVAYPSYVPTHVQRPFNNLCELFLDSVGRYSTHTAFSCMGEDLSFERLGVLAQNFASFLQLECKIKPQDCVAIMLPNVLQYPVVLFGSFLAGARVVNLNPMDKSAAILHELSHSEAKLVIVLENFIHELEQIVSQTKIEKVVLTSIGDMFDRNILDRAKGNLINFYLRFIKKIIPKWHLENFEGVIRYKTALKLGQLKYTNFKIIKSAPEDLAFLQYTAGTTGMPKAAMLTHSNILYNLAQASAWVGHLFTPKDCVVSPLPLYHIFSLTANCLLFVYLGAENLLIINPKDLKNFVKDLKRKKFMGLTGVNTLFNALVNYPEFKNLDFSHLKLVLGGGMSVIPSVAKAWKEITGIEICQAYGLTEASPAVCINLVDGEFDGTVGYPISSTEIGIFNDEGEQLAQGEAGELWVRGPQVMQGYFKNSEATAKTLTSDGWLKTGDIALIDTHGKVKIIDRKKDIIIVSGFNVSPGEIEAIISEIPGVKEVGVIGVPDEIHGEEVKACVVLKPGFNLNKEEIKSYCHDRLAAYKSPKIIEFYESLPKSQVGKILHRELRKASSVTPEKAGVQD